MRVVRPNGEDDERGRAGCGERDDDPRALVAHTKNGTGRAIEAAGGEHLRDGESGVGSLLMVEVAAARWFENKKAARDND